MSGPAPKKPELRQRRNKKASATILTKKGLRKIPELPKRRRKWREETIAWWKAFWESPMATEVIEADLHQLYILADLIDEYWRVPSKERGKKKELANEIRLQRACFGLTPLDRSRLQWEIERGDAAKTKGQKRRNQAKKTTSHKVDPRSVLKSVN